jgi:hypothetical protein
MCIASFVTFIGFIHLWTSVVCDKPKFELWHDKQCLLGQCHNCGVDIFKVCPKEFQSKKLIFWKSTRYEVVGFTKGGKEKKASKMEYNETPPHDLIQYLKLCLKEFVFHNYVACWQDVRCKEVLNFVFDDMVNSCIDFSKNYTTKVHNEIQNMHWHNFQMTILVDITYRPNPNYDPIDPNSQVLKEVHYYVSDDNNHDTFFIQHAFRLHWKFLKTKGFFLSLQVVWSDGYFGQFKSAKAWYFVCCYPMLIIGPDLIRG